MAAVTEFTAEEQADLARKRTVPRLLSLPLAVVGMAAVGLGVGSENALVAAAVAVFTASMMFCWTSALHEAAHQTLWPSRQASIWTGRLLGALMFTPYTVYREVHIRHHAYLNTPRDWEMWPYSDPNASLAFRRVFVWFDLLLGVVAGPLIYGRIYFHRDSPIKSPEMRRTIRNEYLAIIALWGGIWTYTTLSGIWHLHLRGVLLPMYLAAVCQTGRKFTEHLGMGSFDPLLGTRTVLPRQWLLRLSSFLNFDIFIHGPHHRHPRIAHTTLETKLGEHQRQNPEAAFPTYERYWQATLAMLPCLIRNPGCGVNAGAQGEGGDLEVDDFVSDIVEASDGATDGVGERTQQIGRADQAASSSVSARSE